MIYPSSQILADVNTDRGRSIKSLSNQQPVLLVFLRHFGCTFCREALADLADIKSEIAETGTQLVMVHMSDAKTAQSYFQRYRLENVEHISDPSCSLYRAFGLTKGTPRQLFGLQSWIRGFEAGVMQGHGVGPQLGDGFQMPGVFVVTNGEVKASYVHELASDRPGYLDLVKECCQIS
ncbi:alkyl hydroperoxide reductase [Lewinellaceae bacterium SD302]|nr:alkyl hydroperoxide reductase [Lewinellaceae bacterium SD302]